MLTPADDWPIHQTAEPIAFSGTDRNFYDRYFFHARSPDGGRALGVALGVYPHLDLVDAAVSLLDDEGQQRSLFASRRLNHDRMAIHAGPIAIDIERPLRRLAINIEPHEGWEGRIVFEGSHPPMLEPRFTRRMGARTLMDVSRMTQNGGWTGRLKVDGVPLPLALDGWHGTRDRSWGVRPVGAPDAQPTAPAMVPQFFWLWAPTRFPSVELFAHTNDDAAGRPWNRSAVLVDRTTGEETRLDAVRLAPAWKAGSRQLDRLEMTAQLADGAMLAVSWSPGRAFYMHGLGYGHAGRGHGMYLGESHAGTETFDAAGANLAAPANAHVQALASARLVWPGGRVEEGSGIVEQLAIGPHAPSGFGGLFDFG